MQSQETGCLYAVPNRLNGFERLAAQQLAPVTILLKWLFLSHCGRVVGGTLGSDGGPFTLNDKTELKFILLGRAGGQPFPT